MESFDNIYLDISKTSGKARFAESGFGWRPSSGGDAFTIDKSDITHAQWSRAARGFELRVISRSQGVVQLDGFQQEDHDRLAKPLKLYYGVNLEQKEHALRGWNWGKGEFGKAELVFSVQNRPAFEIPYSEISNTNLAGRNEVSVDFATQADAEESAKNGGRPKGRKALGARDQLVEARFYIPGTITKKIAKEEGDDAEEAGSEEGEADTEENAANTWYETLVDRAEIGDVAGDTFASFMDILHLTPRGRFDLDMYENSFRLRGKTYDYKIQYDAIKKFFLLPKPDEVHYLITIGLDPPLRQGQTRYPFVVMQFKKDEDIELDLNLSEADMQSKFQDRLQPHYSGPMYVVITHLFRGIAGKKIISPSKQFSSRHQQAGVKCSIKANEGHLFCMDKSFLFVPKPATYISMDHVDRITMSRVGGAVSASRTFDITILLKNGMGEHQFSNINKEEQQPLEDFFKSKNLKVRNEMNEEVQKSMLAAALNEESMDESEDEAGAGRGSAEDDSEEDDEDFQGGSDSDVAEEYDSAHESSGDSDEEMADGSDGEAAEPSEVVERPKKKAKTSK